MDSRQRRISEARIQTIKHKYRSETGKNGDPRTAMCGDSCIYGELMPRSIQEIILRLIWQEFCLC